MRAFSFEGVEHKLSERNWKKMLRRFDSQKARLNSLGYYLIPVKSICYVRNYKCTRCSLRDPHKKINSCTYLFNKIIGEDLLPYVFMRDSGILWDQKDDAKARQGLQRVFDILSKAAPVAVNRARKKS
jgi:hypothetical protein